LRRTGAATSGLYGSELSAMTKPFAPAGRYDLTDLRVFVAVADEGSVSRGAERIHLAPSSASQRVASLEQALGVTLLERRARGVVPTQAGRVLVDHARRCFAQLEQLHADLAPYAGGLRGHVTLFANNSALASFLPDSLAPFFAAYPLIRITLQERLSTEIVQAVAGGRADVGIVGAENDHPELQSWPYRHDRLVLVASKDDPLVAPKGDRPGAVKAMRFADCLTRPFVCLHSGAAIHTFLVERAAELGRRIDIRVQVGDYRTVCRLVASGAGVAVVPRAAIQGTGAPALRVVDLAEAWAERVLRICMRREADIANSSARLLVDHLRRPPGEAIGKPSKGSPRKAGPGR
jgi:DNA-binding transcriptional LysR family regulator